MVELWLGLAVLLGPPVGEGPAEGPATAEELEASAESGGDPQADELAAIVDAAATAAQDRAVLERNGRELSEFVRQLDALREVDDRLDTCAAAIQAELRLGLALAYLRAAGTCGDGEVEVEASELEYPRECGAATNPNDCASQLLEAAAAFGDRGPAGAEDPLAQAAGCPHAAESMTVERMYGACVAEEYALAVERWRDRARPIDDERARGRELAVPRWASITGIGLGVGAIAAGATLVAIDGTCPNGGDPRVDLDTCPSVYNTDAGGAVLISVGALATISMSAILAITEVRAKRAGQRGRAARLQRGLAGVAAVTGWPAPRLQLRP